MQLNTFRLTMLLISIQTIYCVRKYSIVIHEYLSFTLYCKRVNADFVIVILNCGIATFTHIYQVPDQNTSAFSICYLISIGYLFISSLLFET